MKGRKGLRLAFYLRVSRNDEREGESNSIANQRAFLRAYADRHLGGREHVEYIDDGYSGANFDRPEVTRLMADCRKGIVDTILVKDLSRFGRNYVDVGDYVEQVLPRLGVRFISVLDRVNIEETGGLELETAMMNVINTCCVYDTARKIRSVQAARMLRGELLGRQTPVGYLCEEREKGWRIEENGAAVVRQVFQFAMLGFSPGAIAEALNREDVRTPGQMTGKGRTVTFPLYVRWDGGKVRGILRNEAYAGVLVQGKRERILPGRKAAAVTEGLFRHVDDHESLVSRAEWEAAQRRLTDLADGADRAGTAGRKRLGIHAEPWILRGKVRCGICNRAVGRDWGRDTVRCGRKGCATRGKASELEAAAAEMIAQRREEIGEEMEKERIEGTERKETAEIRETLERLEAARAGRIEVYEAWCGGRLTADEFSERMREAREQIGGIEAELAEWKRKRLDAIERNRRAESFLERTRGRMNRQMAEDVIEEIVLGDGGIRIRWKEL